MSNAAAELLTSWIVRCASIEMTPASEVTQVISLPLAPEVGTAKSTVADVGSEIAARSAWATEAGSKPGAPRWVSFTTSATVATPL